MLKLNPHFSNFPGLASFQQKNLASEGKGVSLFRGEIYDKAHVLKSV